MPDNVGPNYGFVKPTTRPAIPVRCRDMSKGKTRRKKVASSMRGVIAKNVHGTARRLWPLSKNLPLEIRNSSSDADAEKLTLSHVKRILKGQAGISIEQIDMLAKALGLAAYQLLIPDLDPKNPQVVKGATADEQALYRRIAQEAVQEALAKTQPDIARRAKSRQ